MTRPSRRYVEVTIRLDARRAAGLRAVSEATHVPAAELVRQGLDEVLGLPWRRPGDDERNDDCDDARPLWLRGIVA